MKYAFIKGSKYPPLGLGETASLLSCTSATSFDVVPGEGIAFWKTLLASGIATLLVRVEATWSSRAGSSLDFDDFRRELGSVVSLVHSRCEQFIVAV